MNQHQHVGFQARPIYTHFQFLYANKYNNTITIFRTAEMKFIIVISRLITVAVVIPLY